MPIVTEVFFLIRGVLQGIVQYKMFNIQFFYRENDLIFLGLIKSIAVS